MKLNFKYIFRTVILFITLSIFLINAQAVDYTDATNTSILNWAIGDSTIVSGYYKLTVNSTTYQIHTYVYDSTTEWTSNMTFGDSSDVGTSSTYAQNMIVVIVRGNLTVASGVKITTYSTNYGGPKGMLLCVTGKLTNNGTISMTAKGAFATGQNVYLWQNTDSTYEYVPATGASGGASIYFSAGNGTIYNGNAGNAGSNRQTGGGGTGAGRNWSASVKIGAGGAGTSYSGGSGSGASNSDGGGGSYAESAAGSSVGGAGSAGVVHSSNGSGYGQVSMGGVGNPTGGYNYYRVSPSNYVYNTGTGGLLTLYASILDNEGTISSNGIGSSTGTLSTTYGRIDSGGSSGGGSVNIFYGSLTSKGAVTASGGSSVCGYQGACGGAGGAGTVTYTQLVLEAEYLNPTLATLTIDKGSLDPTFDSSTNTYSVNLGSEESLVNIGATLTNSDNTITSGLGEFDIPAGNSTHTIVLTSKIGVVKVYTINFYRPVSSYKYLRGITIDGTAISNFNPTTLTYNVTVPYKSDTFELGVLVGRASQTVYGTGTVTTKSGNNQYTISVVSEDGNYTTDYVVNIFRTHSTKLKELKMGEFDLDATFDPETYTYVVNIPSSTLYIDVTATPYDEEAKVTLNGFGYINTSGTGTIVVTEPNSVATTYTITIVKEDAVEPTSYTFSYTGNYQTFVAPSTGTYEFEVWGARGGGGTPNSSAGSRGGAGGYSIGYISLKKGQTIYVYVGGAGSYASSFQTGGGFNGGGGGGTNGYGGGGATDLRIFSTTPTADDLIWNSSLGLSSRIIVAGGGGGSDNTGGSKYDGDDGSGGAGGGLTAEGAWISGSLYSSYAATQTTGYALGSGQTATNNTDTGGGGGGYYGGLITNNYNGGAGGGSGFVSSTLTDAKTVVGTQSMPTWDGTSSMTGNSNNGYAKITLLPSKSENNYLTSITAKVNSIKQTYTPTYDMTVSDYYLTLGVNDTKLTISARPEDSTATIAGLGEYSIPAGTTVIPITVTAESGAIRTYSLHVTRAASSNQYPTNIEISGLVASLCTVSSSFCVQTPAFSTTTDTYYMTVPARIKQVYFSVTKAHDYQTVSGEGKVSLNGGENIITIEVKSEDGNSIAAYTYYITRDMSGDAYLDTLEITDPQVNINFDPDITSYYLSVPNTYDSIKGITIKTDDTNATYKLTGNENFVVGNTNAVYITVTAANGEVKTYLLNVYRELSGNTYLSDITVKNSDTSYTLSPTFNKLKNSYDVTVPNDITSAQLGATVEVSTSTVTGIGTKTLSTGDNKYSLAVTAEDGSVGTYNIDIYRTKNNNDNLSNLTVSSGEKTYTLSPTFDKDTLQYSVMVDEGITSVTITGTKEVEESTIKLLDNATIKAGTNTKRVMVIAEDGTNKTYILTITRPSSTNAYLSSLTLSSGELTPTFDKTTKTYNVTVSNSVSSITVTGVKEDTLATLQGNGTYALKVGTTTINIIVTSESGVVNSYTVNVTREPNSDATLSSIEIDNGVLSPTFDKDTTNYSVNVKSNVGSITIKGTPNASTTTVTGNNTYSLNIGENTITLATTAEDNTTKTYTITVTKDKSDNANISSLYMEEGVLSPTFASDVINYTSIIPYSKTSVNFNVILADSNSTYTVSNNTNLSVGTNTVIITVTSADGTTKDYTVVVTREDDTSLSNYLSSLTVNVGTLSPTFAKETSYYTVTVDYNVSQITLNGTLEDSNATMSGNTTYNLKVGSNLTYIRVTGSDSKIRDYQVIVTRKPNTDARLGSLVVNGSILSPNFDKDTTAYTLSTTDSSLTFDEITTYDSNATYKINGNSFSNNTTYTVTITVTAEDKTTTKDYVLTVTKNPSNNNNLSSLEVYGYTISPTFSKTTTVYTLTVPNNISSVLINAVKEESHATIIGDGSVSLATGENQVVINVTSESGNSKVYTIVITREKNSDASIDKLIVNNGTIYPTFSSSITSYKVELPYEETVLDMQISLKESTSSYTISGNNLSVGENTVSITVTAEDGTVKTYTIIVTRDTIISSLLSNITVKNYELSPTFNSNVNDYSLTIDYEINALDISVVKLDTNATYEIVGNTNLTVGNNVIKINVTSSDGNETSTYILNVKKQQYSNSVLDYLYTSSGELSPTFDAYTMKYSLGVGNSTTSTEIFAAASDGSATVTGTGVHTLNVGENVFKVTVTTTTGVTRNYYITINRSKSTSNYLTSLLLSVGTTPYELTPEFDEGTNLYTVTVPVSTKVVNLTGTASDNATVTGLGNSNIVVGSNSLKVNVTSESGDINTYTIVVTRPPSSVNHLISLTPSTSSISPSFNYGTTDYSITVPSGVSSLSFLYQLEDSNSTITGTESIVVPDGTSTRKIIVTAEDGTTRTYNITVTKATNNDATLSSLTVTGYTLNETFSPTTTDYTLTVPNTKQVLTSSEVVAVANDKSATISKNSNLNLSTTDTNVYTISVLAADGFTKQVYHITITRAKSSVASLSQITVLNGRLSPIYNSSTTEYDWYLTSKVDEVTPSMLTVTPANNSIVTMPDNITPVIGQTKNYVITVTSEDKTVTQTYTLKVSYDLSSDATLSTITVDKGYISPTFNSNTFTYDVYEYIDTTSVHISAIPSAETSTITSGGTGDITLTDELTTHNIIVTAEDGTTKTYILNIHKTISTDKYLSNISLNGLTDLECINNRCILSPTFVKDTLNYTIKVPYEYTTLDLNITKSNEQQTVKYKVAGEYVSSYSLPVGDTAVSIEVYDGMNTLTSTYTLTITRCKSNNNYLSSLGVTGYTLSPTFDKNTLEYTIDVGSTINEVTVTATTADSNARYSINGYNYLEEGENDVTVKVVASDGTIRTYIIHVVKASPYSSYLTNLTVSTGVFWDLSPTFKKTTLNYTTSVPSIYAEISIEGTTEDSNASVVGLGEHSIVTGMNTFKITVTATDGTTSIYTIGVMKETSQDVNLSSLTVKEADLIPSFESSLTKYSLYVSSSVSKLTIDATTADKTSTYNIYGNSHLITGENNITVVVTNADKSATKTYQITAYKNPSSDSSLSNLSVNSGDTIYKLTPVFDKATTTYSMEVDSNITSVNISGTVNDSSATAVGFGEESLSYGNNEKTIAVTAEDGSTTMYMINIYRNYDLTLKELVVDEGELSPTFDSTVINYTVNVGSNITSLTALGVKSSSKVTVTGNGTYTLNPGENAIDIVVTSPDKKTNTYKIIVNKAKSDNNYLSNLLVHEGSLSPEFTKTNTSYEVHVRNTVTSLTIDATIDDSLASYEITGNSSLVLGSNNIDITVTASDGSKRIYTIKAVVEPDSYFSNKLASLSLNAGSISPDFDKNISYYTSTVPYSSMIVYITATPEVSGATVTGAGGVTLTVGRNIKTITVTGMDGSSNTYTLVIYRTGSDDATLTSLGIKGYNISPTFTRNKTSYTSFVGSEATDLVINAVPYDPASTVEITGNTNIVNGENTVNVKVTAADKVSTKTYTITVTKGVSTNNYLSNLEIYGYNISPTFVKTNTGVYNLSVDNTVNSIVVDATPEVSSATVSGDTKYTLVTGSNTIKVTVTAESGDVRTYTIVVTKTKNSDATLSDIILSDSSLSPNFDKDTVSYNIPISKELSSITITGKVTTNSSTVTGNGVYDLSGITTKTINLVVTAEDNTTKTYKLNIYRETSLSSRISNLVIHEGEISPTFNSYTTNYLIKVPNEITSLTMDITLVDSNASYVVNGNSNFALGNNTVTIVGTASDSSNTTTYTITVVRQNSASNYLKSLSISGYQLSPEFINSTLYYNVTIPTDTTTLTVAATAEDSSTTIKGTGDITVTNVDRIYVTATSSSGIERIYSVIINRSTSTENYLLTLIPSVGSLDKTFDKSTNTYTLILEEKTNTVTLTGTVSNKATVSGLGTMNIEVGSQNHVISVTSESGVVNNYQLTIIRKASTNTNLTSLTPSSGSMTYSNNTNNYAFNVDDSVSMISFSYVLEDSDSTINGVGNTSLSYGQNTINIVVTAEDGVTTRTIEVIVTRMKEIVSITPTTDVIVIAPSEEKTITYTLDPTDTSYKEINYVSSDISIATVTNGVVKGIKAGTTKIAMTSTHNNNINSSVSVIVIDTKLTSSVYEINREVSGYDDYITKVPLKLNIADFISNFDNDNNYIEVYSSDNTKIIDLTTYVGTGMKVKLNYNNTVYDTLNIVVIGDLDGDGISNSTEVSTVSLHLLKTITLTDYKYLAADVNRDNVLDSKDLSKIKNYNLKKINGYFE